MSLRHREYTLESLEQRMLLSGDGLIPLESPAGTLPNWSPVDVVIVTETATEEQGQFQPDSSALVDTSPGVMVTGSVAEDDAAITQKTVESSVVTTPSAAPTNLVSLTPPSDPSVDSAADFSVMTLTSGNGPPAAGANDGVTVSDGTTGDELSPWDPPFGGFNFTATLGGNNATAVLRDARYSDLNELFSTGATSDPDGIVEMYGTMVKRDDAGSSTDYSFGLLSLEGTFFFARHKDGATPAVDSAGNYVFDVWFTSTLTSASWTTGGVTLNLTATKGAFLVSGKLTNPANLNPAEYDLGGAAGTMSVSVINGLAGSGDDLFTFGTLSGGTLTLNTATAVANTGNPGMTSGTNIRGTGLNTTFAGASNFLQLAGNVSIALGGSIGVTFNGAVVFAVADTNGAGTAGGQVLTVTLTAGSAELAIAGVAVTASGVTTSFQISSAGVVGSTSIAALNVSGGGTTVSAFTNGSFSIDTTGPTVATTISATIALNVDQAGIKATLNGTFTFDRGMLGSEEIIRIGVTDANSSFSAGGTSLAISDIDGAFVIKSNGFAGKASVGGITLNGITGLTFNVTALLFEINTTDSEITNLVIPGTATTLNFTGADRKKFFRLQGGVELGISLGGIEATLDGTFSFEQFTLPGPTNVVKFAAIGANASFSAGSVEVGVTGVNGGFILKDGGIAGYVTAAGIDVNGLPAGVTVGGSGLSFAINTTGAAAVADFGGGVAFDYSDADELSFVSVGGTLTLGLAAGGADVSVSGSMTFYRGDVDGTEVVKVGLDGLDASITIGGITATITDLEGIVLIMDAGVAGRIQFDELTIQGINNFTLSATDFAFEFNTTGLEIDEALTVGGVDQTLLYTAAANELNFFRGSGSASLAYTNGSFSTTLSGDFGFESLTMPDSSKVVKFAFSSVNFEIGVGAAKLVIDDASGFFVFGKNTGGVNSYAGKLEIADAHLEGVTGLQIAVTGFSLEVNTYGEDVSASITRPGLPAFTLSFTGSDRHNFLAVGGTLNLQVSLGGFTSTLNGTFYFEKTTIGADTYMKISVSTASFTMAAGSVELSATDINGAFLILGDGSSAGRLSIGHVGLTGVTGFTFTVDDFALEFNNTGGAVEVDIPVPGKPAVHLDYSDPEFHDFIRVGGTLHLGLTVGSFSTMLSGTFLFEQTATKMKIGIKDAAFNLTAGSIVLDITDVNGAFVLYDGGTLAAQLRIGHVGLTGITGLTFTVDDFFLSLNNTGKVAGVHEALTFADGSTANIDFDEDIIAVGGTLHLGLVVGSFSTTLSGTFLFEQTATKMKIGIKDGAFNLTAGSIVFDISDVNGAFVLYDGGTLAAQLRIGHVGLTGITGLTFTVDDFFLSLNNTGKVGGVHEVLTFGDGSSANIDFDEDIVAVGGTLHLGLALGSFSTSLSGTFLFEQTATKMKIGIKDGAFNLTAGSVVFDISDVNGAFVLYDGGTLAAQLRIGHVGLTGITGLTFTVDDFFLSLNNTGKVNGVHEVLTFGDGSSANIDFDEDIIAVGGTLHLGVALGSFSTTLSGTFLFEQTATKMKIGIKDGAFNLTAGSVVLDISEVDGAFVLYDGGTLAAQLRIGHVGLTGITGFTFTVDDFFLSLNNTGKVGGVHEVLTFGDGSSASIDLDEDIIAVGGTLHLGLEVGGLAAEIHGTFLFEQTAGKMKIGLKDAGMSITVGAIGFVIDDMNGAFVIYDGGTLALHMDIGTASLGGITGFSFAVEDFFLDYNTHGVVGEHLVFGDGSIVDLDFTENTLVFGGTIEIRIGGTFANPMVYLRAEDVVIDTTATGDEHMLEVALLAGSISIGPLGTIAVEAGNMAITADGHLTNLDPAELFYVSVDFGGSGSGPDGSSFQWPTWLPIKIERIALYWEDVGAHPEDFVLVLSASLGPLPGLTTLNFQGMVENLRIDVGKLTDGSGDFPILGFDAAAVQISGNLFGMQVSGGIVMGMIDFRADGTIIDRTLYPVEEADGTIFYLGLRAEVIVGNIGAGFSIGLADVDPGPGVNIVPLQAMLSVTAPVIIEPISGLTLGEFTAGIEFASTLENEHYEDIDNLKAVTIANSLNPNLDQWEANLRESTLTLYLDAAANPTLPVDVWSKPMVFTAAVTMYSSYISRQALEGTLMIKLDTEGRILLIGELLFGGGNLKLDAKLYADLTDTGSGVNFTFYASVAPTSGAPKTFELWGELSIRIYDANGNLRSDAPGAPPSAVLKIELEGGVQFDVGLVTARAEGTVKLEVDFSDSANVITTLTFNAQLSLINPPGNPLGENFASIAGTVVLKTFDDGTEVHLQLYGALSLTFNGNALAPYGIELTNTEIFVQINTTLEEQGVTLEFFNGDTLDVDLRPASFSIYAKGDIGIGTPADPSNHLLDLKGFIILEVDSNGLTVVVDAQIMIAPGGEKLLTFDVTGFMRANLDGIAARLELGLVTDFPSETQLDLDGNFTLLFNTMKQEVSYTIPEWFYENGETPETIIVPESAPAFGGDLSQPDATGPPGGEAYFVIYVDGSLSAMGGAFTLDGEFFILITETEFKLAVDADLNIGPADAPFITFTAEGFMKITEGGIAARLDLGLAVSMPDELEFSAGFTLILNTTGEQVSYTVKDDQGNPELITIAQAAPEIGGDLTVAAGGVNAPGEAYFLLAMQGSLTALSLTLEGDFFILITEDMVQLQVNATLEIASIDLEVHGFLEISDEGAAGLLEITSDVDLPGITITDATFLLAFNTFSTDYELPDAVADQFGIPHTPESPATLEAGLIRIEISGSVSIGGVFDLDGRFFFEHTPDHDILEVNATMSLPIIGTLVVDGDLVITNAGTVGSLVVSVSEGNRSALRDIGLEFGADLTLKVNTTHSQADDPGVADPSVKIDADTVELDLSGWVKLVDTFTFTGHFYFKASGSDLTIRFDAHLNIAIGNFDVTGEFISTSDGFTAQLAMTLSTEGSSTLSSLGFNLHGDFLIGINSAAGVYKLHDLTGNLAQFNNEELGEDSLIIYVAGGITLFDTLEITGSFKLRQGPGYVEIEVHGTMGLDGLVTLNVDGFAGVYTDNPATGANEGGLVLALNVTVDFGISGLFEASGDFYLRLNTSGINRTPPGSVPNPPGLPAEIVAHSLRIEVRNLTLTFLSVLKITGSLQITYGIDGHNHAAPGLFTLRFTAGVDFFGLASITASGYFDSDGNYDFDIRGQISMGIEDFFGFRAAVHFHIDGEGETINHLTATLNGTAWLVGIGFDIEIGVDYNSTTGRLRAHLSITIDFFFFSVSFGGDFDLGYIKSTKTFQAGSLTDPHADPDLVIQGGALYVNVGPRTGTPPSSSGIGSGRNYSTGDVNEQVFVRQNDEGIEIELFGKKKTYLGVTSVHIDLGEGNDYVYVDSSVTVPVYIDGGPGFDVIQNYGSGGGTITGGNDDDVIDGGPGSETITGGNGNDILRGHGGNDTISGGAGNDVIVGGTGQDTLTGDDGYDNFVWAVGDGDDFTINGGANSDTFDPIAMQVVTGIDTLTIVGTSGADSLTVSPDGVNYDAVISGLTLDADGIEGLVADLMGGADSVTFNHLGGSGLRSVDVLLGNSDGAADTVTIEGSTAADNFRLASSSTTLVISRVTNLSDTTSLVDYRIKQGAYPADRVIINGDEGSDVIDAHNVGTAQTSLTLNGEDGNDTLVGSSFNDQINGGLGSDLLTGGPGVDTFTDTSVADSDHDELIENQDVNYTLNGWTLAAGGVTDVVLPAVFESIRLNGGNSDNTFTILNVATVIYLNGAEGSDNYVITIAGSGLSTINIADGGTGVGFPNTNTLRVYGTIDPDTFLLRSGLISAGNQPGVHLETINYAGISAFEIHGGDGGDTFIVDETTVAGVIYGDDGEDNFLVGRILAPEGQAAPAGISTIDTTRGFLAYGNRSLLTINGGDGEDYFEVNHNQAELRLNGDDGDDLFLIRTFLEEGSALSNVAGGNGLNTIRYVANGPVKVNGGAGFDRLVLEGTEADDVFIVTDRDIFGGGRSIEFINIESIIILGGAGNDTIWVLGNGLPLEIDGGTGNDTVNIGGQAPDYVYDAPEIIIDEPAYTVSTPVFWGGFTFTYTESAHFEFTNIFPFFRWVPQTTHTITIPSIFIGYTTTTIDPPPTTYDPPAITYRFANVTNFNGVVKGVEVYKSNNNTPVNPDAPGVHPTTAYDLGTINAPIKVSGFNEGLANEDDRLNINLGGTTGNLTGRLLSTIETRGENDGTTTIKDAIGQLLGLGLPGTFVSEGRTFMGGILFEGLESLVLNLGSGNDTITIGSDASDAAVVPGYAGSFNDYNNGTFGGVDVTVNGAAGNDTVNVRANTGEVVLNGGVGNDTFNLGSHAPTMTAGDLNGLKGGIVIDGGADTDNLFLDDRADTADNVLTLTQFTIGGMGMGDGVTSYTTIENLLIGFGSGADIANVRGTSTPTTLELNNGDDSVYVSSTAAVTTANRAGTFTLGGHLDDVDSPLLIQGGNGRQRLMVSDRDTASANGTAGTPAVITGSTLTGFSSGQITYTASASGDYGNGITVWTGSGADFINVNSLFLRAGLRNSTSLNTGGGADTINVSLAAAANAFFALHAGAGDDFINTAAGNLDLLLFGGDGADSITTGLGNHLVFGDEGSAVYRDGSNNIVARYGSGGVDDFTDAVIRPLSSAVTLSDLPGAGDTITASTGRDIIFGGLGGDTINAGEGDNVVAGDHGSITITSPTGFVFTSTAPTLGGDDTLTTGSGADTIFGGAGSDLITSNAGNDRVFGDSGSITVTAGLPVTLTTTEPNTGGGDTILGGEGADVVLGGDGADVIEAGNGLNLVFGDYGTVSWNGSSLATATAISQGAGGADNITTGTDDDLIFGGNAGDVVHAGPGVDVVFGDQGTVVFTGGLALNLTNQSAAGDGDDEIYGETGSDILFGGGASDFIYGGSGNNIVTGDHATVLRIVLGGVLTVTTVTSADLTASGNDFITTGDENDFVIGGAGDDTIAAGQGLNVVLGDHGVITFTSGVLTTAETLLGGTGNDTITAGSDMNLIFGGLGRDTITTVGGVNVLLGDQGRVEVNGATLIRATTLNAGSGADDLIITGTGSHWIFGGDAADTITAGDGFAAVFGDHGRIELGAGNSLSLLSLSFTAGGADKITTGAGDDLILGGADADEIDAGEGNNVILGDHGEILATAERPNLVRTLEPSVGANDIIRAGAGNDIILGGAGNDQINAGAGLNVVLGDHGEVKFGDGRPEKVTSSDYAAGGNDLITAGSGNDLILGGFGADVIAAGEGDNLVFGDHGTVTVSGGVFVDARTDEPTVGGADIISAGSGKDYIAGGLGGDSINAGDGNNFVLGDHGEFHWLLGILARMLSTDFFAGSRDNIVSGSGADVILAGPDEDRVNAGGGADIVFGDNGSVILAGGIPVEVRSLLFTAGAADFLQGGEGADLIVGGFGPDVIEGGAGNNVVAGDNAVLTLPGGVLAEVAVLAPEIGDADVITSGAGDDVIVGGAAGDDVNAGDGANVVIGDHATVTFQGGAFTTVTPTTPGLGGNDIIRAGTGADLIVGGTGADWIDAGAGDNVVVGDHALIVHTAGALTRVESVAPADGGADLIFTGAGNDLVIGGTGGDTIHSGAGNDLVFGDHALVSGTINLALLPLAMVVKPFTFVAIFTQNTGADGRALAGDDVVFAGAGDDIVFGQQGNDILFGQDGNDDLVGGHNVSLGQDGSDVLDGGAGFDVLAGDNASILRTGDNVSLRARVLTGTALFDDRGNLLTLDTAQAWPTDVPERATILLDHAFDTAAGLFGADQLVGGAGDDVLFGELGNDSLHGDAALAVAIAADGTVDRAAVRATAAALFAGAFWAGADSDGDDYIEGNGGDDLIFGGLGQDDLLGGNSSMFGLTDRTMRPDGADTIYGGNGTAAGFEDMGDASLNGRARDADVILGDNANIVRLVGLNGVSIGAFLTFSYDMAGTQKIIVRGFALLDYTVPESPDDIGAADTIYGEAGDDTIHGQVGADELLGNGNDDNLYGGQGDDLIFGGGGDDAISPSDELKPPAPPSNGAADAGSGDEDATPGAGDSGSAAGNGQVPPSNVPGFVFLPDGSGQPNATLYLGFSNGAPLGAANDSSVFVGGGSSWRIFASGVFASGRFGQPAMNFDLQMGLGDFEPAGAEGEPKKDQSEEKPETPPADESAPPAEEAAPPAGQQPAPAGDQPPPAPPAGDKDQEKPAGEENATLPPPPPAAEGALPPENPPGPP